MQNLSSYGRYFSRLQTNIRFRHQLSEGIRIQRPYIGGCRSANDSSGASGVCHAAPRLHAPGGRAMDGDRAERCARAVGAGGEEAPPPGQHVEGPRHGTEAPRVHPRGRALLPTHDAGRAATQRAHRTHRAGLLFDTPLRRLQRPPALSAAL